MRLDPSRFENIKEFICGNNSLTPYLSGHSLVELFKLLGFEEVYSSENGLPGSYNGNLKVSRSLYVLRKLEEINGTDIMKDLIELVFSADHFLQDPSKNIEQAVKQVNMLFQRDRYQLQNIEGQFRVIEQ